MIPTPSRSNLVMNWEPLVVGKSIPGKRVDVFTIDQINPMDCTAYRKIILHCGVNNIKSKHIESYKDVRDLYCQFRSKVEDIRHINKTAKIFISPVLPTRLMNLNRKVLEFNKLVFEDLETKTSLRVNTIIGYNDFLGADNCLGGEYARYNDYLHLNSSGVRFLARCLKNSILPRRSENYSGKKHSSNLYSSKVKGGVRRPT